MLSQSSIRVSVRPSGMIPVSEVQIQSDMSVALNFCFLYNLRLLSHGSSMRRKTWHAPNTATHQQRIELSFIRRFPRIELTE